MQKKEIEILDNGNVQVTIPMFFKIAGGRTKLHIPCGETGEYTSAQLTLARAFTWQRMIDEGKYSNIKEMSKVIGFDSGLISRTIRMTLLSPKIVHKILTGELDFKVGWLGKGIPSSWEGQEKMFLGE